MELAANVRIQMKEPIIDVRYPRGKYEEATEIADYYYLMRVVLIDFQYRRLKYKHVVV